MRNVTIIDYGIGNLLSVKRAFERCGAEVVVTDSADRIRNADRLVLPGVGAFSDGMDGLRKLELTGPIKAFVAKERPFLGICLGMQMMLEVGEEFGLHEGLGIIPGKVVKIPNTGIDGILHKIPHIGWNSLIVPDNKVDWQNTILQEVAPGEAVYFVHSFTASPTDKNNRLADCYYNGRIIAAAIQAGYSYGCQFHPEKSGSVGLKIVKNFMEL